MTGRFALWLLLCCLFTGCGSSSSSEYADYSNDSDVEVEPVDPADVDAYEVESSGFDNCTDDCSGHEAGAEWAQENDLTDPSECGGNSDSFVEGCEAFAEDRIALAEEQTQEAQDEADAAAEEEQEDDYESNGF